MYDSVAECGTKYDSVAAVYEVTPDRQNSHKWLVPARGVKTILRKFLHYYYIFACPQSLLTGSLVVPFYASISCVKVKSFKKDNEAT